MRTRALIRVDALLGLPLCALAYLAHLPFRLARRRQRPTGPVRRILVTKFLGMGSVLLATPLLRRLAECYPGARITFLTFEPNAPLLERLPCVDEVLVVPGRSFPRLLAATPGLLLRLRRQRFDLAMDLEFYSRLSNLVTWGSGARRRVGFFVRARWRGELLTDPVYFNPTLPYSQSVLALLRPLGVDARSAPALVRPLLGEEERRVAWKRLVTMGVPERGPVVVVNVNASDLCEERRWPGERYARLVERFGGEIAPVERFVFIGGAGESATVRAVLDAVDPRVLPRCLDLAGRTSLVDLLALLERASLVVTNDSGPMHLAAALGRPTVSLFGPETPALYGPVGERHLVFYAHHWCSPCLSVYNAKIAMCNGRNECMQRIGLEQVVEATARFCREQVPELPAPALPPPFPGSTPAPVLPLHGGTPRPAVGATGDGARPSRAPGAGP